jgi:hypothetical protein
MKSEDAALNFHIPKGFSVRSWVHSQGDSSQEVPA